MSANVVSLTEKFKILNAQNKIKIIAQMNNYHFKIVKLNRENVWHAHEETDETFLIIEGELEIALRDKVLNLKANDMVVIPRGVEHRPKSIGECKILLVEPAGTLNTGNAGGPLTEKSENWI